MSKISIQVDEESSVASSDHVSDKSSTQNSSHELFPRIDFFRGKCRLFGHSVHFEFLVLALLELALVATLNTLVYSKLMTIDASIVSSGFYNVVLASFVSMFFLSTMHLYGTRQRDQFGGVVSRLVIGLFLGFLFLECLYVIFPSASVGDGVAAVFALISLLPLVLIRALFYRFVDGNILLRRVLVIGTGKRAHYIDKLRRKSDLRGFQLVGYFAPKSCQHCYVNPEKILPLGSCFCQYALDNHVDEIVVALDDRRQGLPTEELIDCRMSGVKVTDELDFIERERGLIPLDILQPGWLIHAKGFSRNYLCFLIKHSFDVVLSLMLLVLIAPLIAVISIASLIESGGKAPILYSQRRMGQGGKSFNLLKFRSMNTNAESDGIARWATEDDSRVTCLGAFIRKYRLDEIPQLWNVVMGDMSLVGPRPERPEFVEKLNEVSSFYNWRHRVTPGITGWAQLCYPYGSSNEDSIEKLKYDLYYVKNHGFLFDLYILIQTLEVVLFKKGSR